MLVGLHWGVLPNKNPSQQCLYHYQNQSLIPPLPFNLLHVSLIEDTRAILYIHDLSAKHKRRHFCAIRMNLAFGASCCFLHGIKSEGAHLKPIDQQQKCCRKKSLWDNFWSKTDCLDGHKQKQNPLKYRSDFARLNTELFVCLNCYSEITQRRPGRTQPSLYLRIFAKSLFI